MDLTVYKSKELNTIFKEVLNEKIDQMPAIIQVKAQKPSMNFQKLLIKSQI